MGVSVLACLAQQPTTERVRNQAPITKSFDGAKVFKKIHGNLFAFGDQTWNTHLERFPTKELARNMDARSWRSPYCTQWRDGCERCQWSPATGDLQCFAMSEPKACQRTNIVCEQVDDDLIMNECISYNDGCNEQSLMLIGGKINQVSSAVYCADRQYYAEGYTCGVTWDSCRLGSKSPACRADVSAIRLFRQLRKEGAANRLKAFQRFDGQ
jgi:hypothetical protein